MRTHPEEVAVPQLTDSGGDGFGMSDEERALRRRSAGWHAAAVLYRWRRPIASATLAVAVVAIVVSLLLPRWYGATARVLTPDAGSGGGLAALIGDLSPIASSFLGGGGGGGYTRYLAILHSQTMADALIEEFDLIRAYGVERRPYPREAATRKLRKNLEIGVDMEYEYLGVTAYDRDPEQAARMANFAVEELNRRHQALGLQSATRFREYVERRYVEIETRLDSALTAMQRFQEERGTIELPAMAQGLVESAATQRLEFARLEIEYEALRSQYGPDNPRVRAAAQALATARRSQGDLLGGREALMPIPLRELPAAAGEYARLYQELLIQRALIEHARPLLEQARFDEERERVAVQVLDPAVVPERKARPKRSIIVIVSTFSAFLLLCFLALAVDLIRRRRPAWASAFQAASRA
jgi:tyrosine-protein kinase Etk/Wzc